MKAKLAAAILVLPFLTVMAASVLTTDVRAARDDARSAADDGHAQRTFDRTISDNAEELFRRGKDIFRDDTFGDEQFWGGTLKLHQAIAGSRFGGVGPGVSPAT